MAVATGPTMVPQEVRRGDPGTARTPDPERSGMPQGGTQWSRDREKPSIVLDEHLDRAAVSLAPAASAAAPLAGAPLHATLQ